MINFEEWFKNQDFYTNMRFVYGDRLFIKENGVYCVLSVNIAFKAWEAGQGENTAKNSDFLRGDCVVFNPPIGDDAVYFAVDAGSGFVLLNDGKFYNPDWFRPATIEEFTMGKRVKNLIEQLGGYEKAKATLEKMLSINESHKNNGMNGLLYDASAIQELSDALLEYRNALSKEIRANRSTIIPVDHKTIQKFADYQDVIASQQLKIKQLEKQIQ